LFLLLLWGSQGILSWDSHASVTTKR